MPFNSDDCEDTEYQQKRDSAQELTDYWRKSQKQLDQFWEVWRQDYLLTLRETLPLFHKGSRSQISREPKIGEIVLVKDDNLPRRTWKLALVKEYIFSKDGQIHSVIIQLPNKQLVSRAINNLFPLEIQAVQSEDEDMNLQKSDVNTELKGDSRPMRKAAAQARKRIMEQLCDQPVTVVFSFPWECCGEVDE